MHICIRNQHGDLPDAARVLSVLEHVWMTSEDEESRFAAMRDSIAKHLCNLPADFKDFGMVLQYEASTVHDQLPPNLCTESAVDLFSMYMRQFSQRLTRLFLEVGQLSAELFWPRQAVNESSLPSWPALEYVEIKTQMDTADGQWMLERDPLNPDRRKLDLGVLFRATDDDYDEGYLIDPSSRPSPYHRAKPRQDWFDELHLSIALAARRMPRLKDFSLRVENVYGEDERFGAHSFTYDCGRDRRGISIYKPRIIWSSHSQYIPAEKIMDTWRASFGPDLDLEIVEWYPRDCPRGPGAHAGWVRFRNGQKIRDYD
ncbi:hypothetical protein L228DRAFT_261038 [Xylona heveae TC161]|uniref:Uncharacterized protein n=1 Tax=Xylona heveae (strain CBS 132557 / TC161) TaxID=1328760 RepID=A0A165H327_XYLHT|nr:hypothetical protein L228DRAFT_261038 [Xylona heveae TC161]KZF22920.1 hypothetical protein L228DRAFT_261038 [Xylona heveae TC161]